MERYLAFYGLEFYPNEAMDDFIGDFSDLEDAKNEIDKTNKELHQGDMSGKWGLVYDTESREYIFTTGSYII
jgi:hypothetical protein